MIGRKSTKRLAELALRMFSKEGGTQGRLWVPWDRLYDFLFERDFDPEFCNAAEIAAQGGCRPFEEFILRLHTGESIGKVRSLRRSTPGTEIGAAVEGQAYLRQLCQAILAAAIEPDTAEAEAAISNATARALTQALRAQRRALPSAPLLRALELDGYVFKNCQLFHVESAIVDVEGQHGALVDVASSLSFGKVETIKHHLLLAEQHYAEERWDDCISNARKFLECCMQESAAAWSRRSGSPAMLDHVYESPSEVRDYLRKQGLLTPDEFNTIRTMYGLLSATGSHPHIAAPDQARMLRQIALIFSEFVMLRVKGAIASASAKDAAPSSSPP